MLFAASFKKALLKLDASLRDALVSLEQSGLRVCLVVDDTDRLVGLLTDGDTRRALLNGLSLDQPISPFVNRRFFFLPEGSSNREIHDAMARRNIIQVPILSPDGRVVAVASRFHVSALDDHDTLVVLMAGGLGSRLRPLTDTCPKPLLTLGNRPIIEIIISQLRELNFRRFCISVNYLGHMIEDYLGNGEQLDVDISYVRERERLGTAGALSLLNREDLPDTVLVLNGDVITDLPFRDFVVFHRDTASQASMCIRETRQTIQYGVVDFEPETYRYVKIREKPVVSSYINTGIYCLSPAAIDLVPKGTFFDMPTLFDRVAQTSMQTRVYPADQFWIDIGTPEEYERAQALYSERQDKKSSRT